MNYSPHNTASEFTAKLNEFIEQDGSWEVGLVEAFFPANVVNVPDNTFHYVIYFDNESTSTIELSRGIYNDAREVLIALHARQRQTLNVQVANTKVVLRRDPSRNRITVSIARTANDVVGVRFSPDLARMLGFSSDRTDRGRDIHVAEHPVSMYENLHLVYVYCNLLEQVLVGDTKASLLRIIDRTSPEKSNVTHVTFNPVQYVPLQKKHFDTIAIKLATDGGERVPFVAGKSIFIIEFRRCAHPYLLL